MKLFPTVRLSELRANVERDRQNLTIAADNMQALVHEKTRPVRFFLDHPGLLVGGLASLFALYEVGTSVLSPLPLKAVNGTTKKGLGIVGRLARVGLGFAMKAATPTIASVVAKAWKHAVDRKSTPNND